MKQFHILHLLLFFACFSRDLMALDATQIDRYKQRLSDPNPKERLATMDELNSLVDRSSESVGNEVIEMATNAFHDSDSKARYEAVNVVAGLAMQTMPAHYPLKAGMFDLRSYPPPKAALEGAMSDDYTETRQNALAAYVLVFKFTPEFQKKLMTRFESDDISNRMKIVSALIIDGNFTEPVTGLLLRLLDDPQYDHIIGTDLANSLVPPPAALLPKLAEKLAQAPDFPRRQTYTRAIAKYGAQARPYLGQIEQLRDKETDASTRFNLEAAVKAIQSPQQSRTPPK